MPMTTDNLTDAEINLRLTETLGMRLSVDTNDAHEVGQAVMSVFEFNIPMGECQRQGYGWNGKEHKVILCGSKWGYRGVNNNNGYGAFLWDCRHGQPWQADIEAHVAAYCRTPPNWAGSLELAFELGSEMLHRQHDMEYGRHLADEAKRVSDDSSHEFRIAHLGPRQRAIAALRTLDEAKNDR